jgi:hypothetical protein
LTLSKLTLLYLLLWVNITAFAQQNDPAQPKETYLEVQQDRPAPSDNALTEKEKKSVQSEDTTDSKTEEKKEVIPTPPPISIIQQYQNDLKHYLPANRVKSLLAGPDDYITLITENTSVNNKGVAILLPDWQQGATNPKAINFLRKNLPQHGWTTISIQPTNKPLNFPSNAIKVNDQQKENQTIIDDYEVKLATMINTLFSKANEYPGIIMIIAQGNHGAMVVDLLNQSNESASITQAPNALILLSSYVLTSEKLIDEANTDFAKKLATSEYPVLDLYLKKDNHIVLYKAKQRLLLSKQEMKVYYRQRQLNNSDMGYYPEKELLTQINSWLRSIGR